MWHLYFVNDDNSKTWLGHFDTEDDALNAQTDPDATYSIEFINPETAEDRIVE